MISMIRLIVLALAGLVMAGYGVFHSVKGYPGPAAFDRFGAAVPTLVAVMSFSLGVVAAITGAVMLAMAAYRLRRPQHTLGNARDPHGHSDGWPPPALAQRPAPAYRDDADLDPDGGGYDFDDERDDPGYRSNGRDNGRLDRRRWAGSHR